MNGEPQPVHEPDDAGDEVRLELAGPRLKVIGEELIRVNAAGNVVLRVRLADIEEVSVRSGFEPITLVLILAAAGIASIGCFVSGSNILTTILYVLAIFLLVVSAFGAVRRHIDVRTAGESVPVLCPDSPDEISGFVASLRGELTRRRAGRV